MTTTQHIKETLIAYLNDHSPDEAITIVDARQRAEISLPTLAVDITGTSAHSSTLSMVTQAQIEIKLRSHAGDEADVDIPSWIDQLESLFFDKSSIIAALNQEPVLFYDWNYNGSTQDFDDAILEVSFTADILFSRQ